MAKNVRILVVAGGGSGSTNGAGGGAGGFRDVLSQPIENQSYTITVGLGGVSSNGGNSSFGTLIESIGGGRGYTLDGTNGETGASGGSGGGGNGCGNGWTVGQGGAGTAGQGYAGGSGDEDSGTSHGGGCGGGGGAGGVGQSAPNEEDGDGGPGATSDITGATVTYAAGGGGYSQPDGPGSVGTGGGNQANTGNGGRASDGGSGVVIIRYLTTDFGIVSGGTITTDGYYTVHTFTSSGTFTAAGPGSYRPSHFFMEALVVAGGGGGGAYSSHNFSGGGGGAGGVLYNASLPISSRSYEVTVGAGGGGNTSGVASSLGSLMSAVGGGTVGNSGGSGGGGTTDGGGQGSGTAGQGYAGGAGDRQTHGSYSGTEYGPGGGAGSAGTQYSAGIGIPNPIAGSTSGEGGSYYLAAGGGKYDVGAGTGSTSYGSGGSPSSGAGKDGIVILKYATAQFGTCAGGTITVVGANTIHTFTTSGTFAVTYVTTQDASNITYNSANFSGEVVSGGGPIVVERGICYSTSASPTILNSKAVVSGTTGDFVASLSALNQGTTYYVNAYITDANGKTTYGLEKSFETLGVPPNTLAKDIDGIDGQTYAVRLYVGGTTGTLTVKLGSTGASDTFNAGAGYVTLQGEYGGLFGLIFESSGTFDGYIDDVFWVVVVGAAAINWDSTSLTNIYPINSLVKFKRVESKEFNTFNLFRYLDVEFKDLDATVTVTISDEANDITTTKSKTFLVGDTTGVVSPFVKKRISMLSKDQAMLIQFSNNNLNEAFTICKYSLRGYEESPGLFKLSKIISV